MTVKSGKSAPVGRRVSRFVAIVLLLALGVVVLDLCVGAMASQAPGSGGSGAGDPASSETMGSGLLEEYLPRALLENQLLGLLLWQWAGLFVLIAAAVVLARLGAWILDRILRILVARTETRLDDRILDLSVAPFRLALVAGLVSLGSIELDLPPQADALLKAAAIILAVAASAWLAFRLIDMAAELITERLRAADRSAAVAVVPLGMRAAKIALIAITVIVLLQNLGMDVTGLIAGLGVGGLAVALASQKSIANLFGGVSLIADQPIRVGDFCRFGDGKMGTVEDIGIRSTRVRTLDRTLVTVPNSEFSEFQIENFGARDRIRLFAILGLRYETTPDQMRHVLAEIRRLFLSHPRITDSPARARFIGFGPHSLDIEVYAYADTGMWDEFLQIREDILLRIMDIVANSGTSFAFPSQTLYLGRDPGLDAELTQRAEEEMGALRERGELPFPDFLDDVKSSFRGAVEYPPPGSALRPGPDATHDREPGA